MDSSWVREIEARVVRVEELIKGLAPVVMVRDMIEPLQRDVQRIAHSIEQQALSIGQLTQSDLELKGLHKELMVERGERERQIHQMEVTALRQELEAQRKATAQADQRAERRAFTVWVKDKAAPVLGLVVLVVSVVVAIYGLIVWLTNIVNR